MAEKKREVGRGTEEGKSLKRLPGDHTAGIKQGTEQKKTREGRSRLSSGRMARERDKKKITLGL